ncbi:Endothelin-converting enzyme 1 [Clonorchis sinensis]|uniref:Endothelin-converting enzyme 1 n=1 Tax=Clonorchis sinensis TaxID=79923 RepID=A0A8T1MR13_CLOSI|nr:Endothelin-converting enzyme 1 [Clonorchis sinensis]
MAEWSTVDSPKKAPMTSSNDGNCVSDDYIPFSDIGSGTNQERNLLDDTMDKGNGRTPRVWTTTRLYPVWCGRSAKFWFALLLVCLLIIFLLFVTFLGLWVSQNRKLSNTPCLTLECLKTSSSILSSLDRSLSPCDNFYEFACNGWIKSNQIPPGQNQWSLLKLLGRSTDYFIKDLLENQSIPNPSPGLVMAQAFYNACMNESLIQERKFAPLFTWISHLFGGWSLLPSGSQGARTDNGEFLTKDHFNLTEMYLFHFKIYGYNPLFQIEIGQDLKNSSHFVIEIAQGHLCLQRENYLNETSPTYEKPVTAYKSFMRNYSKLLGVPLDKLDELNAIYDFEKKLAQNMEDRSERDPEKYFLLTTLKNLSDICPVFEWKLLLSRLFEPLNYTISDNQAIALTETKYFKARCQVYMDYMKNDTGIRILHNLAVWQFIWTTRHLMPNEVDRLQKEYMEAETGLNNYPERWLTCVAETQEAFGWILGYLFANEKFDQKSNDAAAEMIHEIREAFKENFASVHWMQEEDKIKAIEKVDAMKASVGYPMYLNQTAEEIRLLSYMTNITESTYFENALRARAALILDHLNDLITEDIDRWDLQPHVVNAFYKDNANHIYFPAGILQPPVYDHAHPLSLNFGGIGMVVGHEITHAFDHQGAKRDAKGNYRQWWSNKTREAFKRNSQCMIDQYSNYSILNTSLNGKMTLGENIADNGGIKAAYRAFKKLESKYSDGTVLPALDFTSDQLFFLAFAQIWCIKQLPRATLTTVLYDVHTVDRYRVIGTLMNSEDFARVYNCPSGSYMNPKTKCSVW